ncbi:hypothetical protein LINPERHAP2_LOCUS24970 [Linum perenne]
MDFSGDEPVYIGGTSQTIYIDKDDMCYCQLKLVGIDFVQYKLVQGMWYLDPNIPMGDDLHQFRNDSDVTNGLVLVVGTDLRITIFMTGHYGVDYGADNEEGTIRSHVNLEVESPLENSVVPEFIRLYDEDIRTSDDELEEALFTMGNRRTGKMVAYMVYFSGEEVEHFISLKTKSSYDLGGVAYDSTACGNEAEAGWSR